MHIKLFVGFFIFLQTNSAFATRQLFFTRENSAAFEVILRDDIDALDALQFTAHSKLFEKNFGIERGGVARYFRARIDRFIFVNKNSIASAAFQVPRTLVIYPSYFSKNEAVRLSALIHEAAHRDSRIHEVCPKPYVFRMTPSSNSRSEIAVPVPELDGVKGAHCDKDISGAYAVQYVFLYAMAKYCSSCSVMVKKDASDALPQTLVRINDPEQAHLLWRDSIASSPNRLSEKARPK